MENFSLRLCSYAFVSTCSVKLKDWDAKHDYIVFYFWYSDNHIFIVTFLGDNWQLTARKCYANHISMNFHNAMFVIEIDCTYYFANTSFPPRP